MKASRNHRRPFVIALALTTVGLLVMNTSLVTAQTNVIAIAEASIVEGISVQKVADLEFGSMVATAAGGTVTINATTGEVSSDGVRHMYNGQCRHAQFKTNGEAHYHYTIALPKTIKLEHVKGKGNMMVTDFTYSEGSGAISEKGEQAFGIGATLRVGPNQPTGKYEGTFEVSIQHQ